MQLRDRLLKSATAFLLTLLVVCSAGINPVHAVALEDVRKQQAALEVQKKDNAVLLEALRENAQKKTEYQDAITAQIKVVSGQIDLVVVQKAGLDRAIAKAKAESAPKSEILSLEENRTTLEKQQKDMEYKSSELTALYKEAEELLKETAESSEKAKAKAEAVAAERKKADEAIDAWYAEYREKQVAAGVDVSNLDGDVYVGTGHFQWPMPGFTDITQYYGGPHRGLDIAGDNIYGKSIVASQAGTVVYAGWIDSYGYVAYVDHGDGYQTRYAHMSALGCVEGDAVIGGQIIGYVGSTGNSTGPHLHFEILYNGSVLNPFDYF